MIKNFREQLRTQRWDDHRYYHHSRINQSLHFVSAASFLIAYALLFVSPVAAALIGDRKSTRLNSSHQIISYAVFCLKKKTNITSISRPPTGLTATGLAPLLMSVYSSYAETLLISPRPLACGGGCVRLARCIARHIAL